MRAPLLQVRMVHLALSCAVIASFLACDCQGGLFPDAGPVDGGDAGLNVDGGSDAGVTDAGVCDSSTPGFGEACAAFFGDPLCGVQVCNPVSNTLQCADPGPNACFVCGDLDTDAGAVGAPCGAFRCGTALCDDAGTATKCVDDHPRNACGGCAALFPSTVTPGDACSGCSTGRQTCTRDEEEVVCFRGREPADGGSCDRRILAHAFLDERFQGGYILAGTLAVIENTALESGFNPSVTSLVFEPLIEGPGTNGLPDARLYLSKQPNPNAAGALAIALDPPFARSRLLQGADPARIYRVPSVVLADYPYLVLYDMTLGRVISVGALRLGAPPAGTIPDEGPPTTSVSPRDAGVEDDGEGEDLGEGE